MTEDTKEKVKEVFKSDMKTAEGMNNLVEFHTREDIAESSVEVVEELIQKIEDPMRKKCIFATCYQIGQSINNPQLSNFAAENLKKFTEEGNEGE